MAECHNTSLEEGSGTQSNLGKNRKTKPKLKLKMLMCMDLKKRETIRDYWRFKKKWQHGSFTGILIV